MLKPVSGGLRSFVQDRRESVRVEFRVAPGEVVAVEGEAADVLAVSPDFVPVDPVAEDFDPGLMSPDVPSKRGPGRPRKGAS